MGGLVVKDAMIRAYNIKTYERILGNTIGIAFMGTPHRGSQLADVLKRVLKASFSTKKFVGDIQLNGDTVGQLNKLFRERSEGMTIISFWESTKTPVIGVSLFN